MAECDPAADSGEWLWRQQHSLIFRSELSAAYHSRRQRFLLLCERWCQAITALFATAAFAKLASSEGASSWLAAVAAVASIFSLVFAFGARASRHAALAADHKRLLADITVAGVELTEAQLTAFCGRLREIEAGEEATLGAVVVQCQNEINLAKGQGDRIVPLRWYHRAFMHLWDWDIRPVQP